jgi:hypothetical protein
MPALRLMGDSMSDPEETRTPLPLTNSFHPRIPRDGQSRRAHLLRASRTGLGLSPVVPPGK